MRRVVGGVVLSVAAAVLAVAWAGSRPAGAQQSGAQQAGALQSPPAGTVTQPATMPSGTPATRPADTVGRRGDRVLVISIDGCRPDVALRANMPNFRGLMAQGSFTMWAKTTDMAVTLPSHTSMITGVPPDKHGVTWNGDQEPEKQQYPSYPTLLELARGVGRSTALVASKSKFVALARAGAVDWVVMPPAKSGYAADVTAERARAVIAEHRPEVMLMHFSDPDNAGHAIGWGTPEQVAALERVDAGLGVVIKALKDAGVYDQTLIIISADHGGSGKSHGRDDFRSAFIPWIVVGPGVRKNYDLTRNKDLAVRTEDTFGTAAAYLGITPPRPVDGRSIPQIWQQDELMKSTP